MSRQQERAVWAALVAVLIAGVWAVAVTGWHPNALECLEPWQRPTQAVLFCRGGAMESDTVTAYLLGQGETGGWVATHRQTVSEIQPMILGDTTGYAIP